MTQPPVKEKRKKNIWLICTINLRKRLYSLRTKFIEVSDVLARGMPCTPLGGGTAIYMCSIGMCCCEGYCFQAVYSRIGYINQRVWVQNRVSFFRKLISWLKILSRLGTQLLQYRGIWGVYSSIGQQDSAELALVQVKGSRVPATSQP